MRCLRPSKSSFFDINDNIDNPITSTTGLSIANKDSEVIEDVILSRAIISIIDNIVNNIKYLSVNRAIEAKVAINIEVIEKLGFRTYTKIKLNFTK